MDEHAVDLLPGDVVRWARMDAQQSTPEFWVQASKQYTAETDFDRTAYRIGADVDVALVSVHGLLEVSPRHEPGGWTLQLRADDVVGLLPSGADEDFEDESDMPLEAFEEEFLIPEKGEVEVMVLADDDDAWQRFQDWLAPRTKR